MAAMAWTRLLVAVGVAGVVTAADPGSTCKAWCRNSTAMGLFGSYIPPCLAALNNSEVSEQTSPPNTTAWSLSNFLYFSVIC